MLPELGVLYREHASAVWRYTRSRLPTDVDAEDVTSDVFARALRSTSTFDAARGIPRAWLLGIARHAVADWWRRRSPEEPRSEVPESSAHDDPAGAAIAADRIDRVRRVLGVLTEREGEALALRFGGELSSSEIGQILGTSPTAARMLVHRAVTKLRGVLADG